MKLGGGGGGGGGGAGIQLNKKRGDMQGWNVD